MERPDDLCAEVVDHLPVGVFALDADDVVRVWNRRAALLTGWSAQRVLGTRLTDAPLDGPTISRVVDELRAGRPFTGRFPALDAAGPTLYFRAVPAAGPGAAVVGVLQDVVDSRAGDEAFALLDALWESAPVGLAYFDTALRYRRVNGAVLDIDGGTADQRLGQTLEEVHGAVGATIADGLRAVLADGRARPSVPIRGRLWHGAGPPQEWRMSLYPVHAPDGELTGCGVVIVDVTAAERDRRELARVAAQRELALNRYQSLVEATSAAVWVREADGSAQRDAPALRAITGQSVLQMRGWGFLDAVHPDHRDASRTAWTRAVAADPAVVFSHVHRLRTAAGDHRWFRTRAAPVRSEGGVVQWVGTETDIDDAVRARDRLDLLARATLALGTATEPDGELAALADVLVPEFADVCRVYLVDPQRPGARGVTGRRALSRTAPGLPEPPAADPRFLFDARHPVTRCVRDATPVLDEVAASATGPEVEAWAAGAGAHSVLVAPVLSGGVVVAALLFLGAGDRPRYTADDLALVAEIGTRASAAVEKATEYQQSRQVAVALQSAMLTEPPEVPGLEIRARYLPAAANLAVGGDWFDAFGLPGGDLAVGVGDVEGHDLPAAATMGQLRSMLRALADGAHPPSVAVAALDRVATRLAVTRFTTLVHGHVARRPDGGAVFRWSNAGHPQPVLVPAGGEPGFLSGDVGTVLGVAPDAPRGDSEVALPPGATLLLYTDGLVERRRDPDDRAGTELLALVRAHAHRPLGEFCDHLVRDTAADTDDDIVVLAVRVS
ncbi:SpoIIE family protein phosphatase [Pseudonocardia oceani]|uniref:SpoIIE family protein phosphatase n=4 Tax=Pseudonocardia oceani TaxID=2792013 RepID=A0ABS6UJB9_9PSEU|nr:SpoIIE family protein phosphatase [Pseudonocardia oceani]MBW0112803.1 SpoIIE family protein phosphatase [Pseudonocardia oceani]MBW0121293.1 SpoIIE family protein phosphatase [Pseudonocardia oceani]MBW0132351.1 SpoIIE family protein phosphatase [Pseudonocardia oceani]